MNTRSKLLEDTALWKTYVARVPVDRSSWVHKIYDNSTNYLKDVRCTFPNYTLHDETHVLNVLDAMAGILGDQISQLSEGEAELLILAACMHDLGMVYTEEEKKLCFADKTRTREFLRKNSPEWLGRPAEEWPEDLQQWYLRWLHPFRLPEVFQNEGWKICLEAWPMEAVPKRCVIAVCEAHGQSPEEFSTESDMEYLAASDADPLFCALLLRLADLLDFDDTRAPEVLYSYVVCNEKSQEEWDKHQASGGFRYPNSPSMEKLPYRARCTNPGIEHAIRKFLDWVDNELNTCARLQQKCYQNWQRTFSFPRSIDRKEVESEGYVSGDFHMTMDQARIMELMTGEELYDNNDVFVRELLQNAIDATLLRLEMDRDFTEEEARIDLWEWNDKDGNIWFRIDDQGTGMTLGMLQRYFLKVGNSYYTSQELKRDLQDHGQTGEFQAISRFGIGFLSCFLCGTFAEVSTLYFDPLKSAEECGTRFTHCGNNYGLRLQVTGLQGYYTLKSQAKQHDQDNPMPAPENYEDKAVSDLEWRGYRTKPGTSISIKLDPGQLGVINLRESVEKYLCCAKVKVYYNGERIGRTYEETMDEVHKLEGERIYELTPEWKKKFDECFPFCAGQYPKVVVTTVPLDEGKEQVLPSLSGVVIKCNVYDVKRPRWQFKGRNYEIDTNIYIRDFAGRGYAHIQIKTRNIDFDSPHLAWNHFICGHSQQEVKSLTEALEALSMPPKSGDELGEVWRGFEKEMVGPDAVWKNWMDCLQTKELVLSFQELGLPTVASLTGGKIRSKLTCSYRGIITGRAYEFPFDAYSCGRPVINDCMMLILLDDELRPKMKVSRSDIVSMPLEVLVAIRGMMHAWVPYSEHPSHIWKWSIPLLPAWRELRNTKLEQWMWHNLQDYFRGLKENCEKAKFVWDKSDLCIGGIGIYYNYETEGVLQTFLMAWLQDSYQMKVDFEAGQVITFAEKSSEEDTDEYDLFPPMMFCSSATQESRRFLCSKDSGLRRCINVDHPYGAWLIKNAAALNKYYNRQFRKIIDVLRDLDSEEIIDVCNEIREQLLSLSNRHGVDITACPQLSEADFWVPKEAPEDI